ncbi:AzlD domain-containing protein [Aquabacterium sp. A7-Y]|uniref:AzlD family protein n=1 Tax=Aquabacterium sp. A7-Y TaxID=1349605 RepID=UPI00223DB93B|nr:AzlD domain-containing protein [Aquabacterium sp. A7-Y]MCW7539577.1 AzlD domain-containing protein [Aquabacterium sp. A7-Y]
MNFETATLIVGMALVTWACRAGGLLLASRMPNTGFVARWLAQIPAGVLAALVAPAILSGGRADALAALATAVTMWRTGNVLAAMAVGVGSAWWARGWLA